MKKLFFILGLFFIIIPSVFAQTEPAPSAYFKAEVFNMQVDSREADLKIISVSDNSFKLINGDFIHVDFAQGVDVKNIEPEDIIDGTINFWQADVNKETVDWYMVTESKLNHRQIFDDREMKLIGLSTAFFVIVGLFVWEQRRKIISKKLKINHYE